MTTFGSSFWDPWEVVDPFDMMRRLVAEEFPEYETTRRLTESAAREPGSAGAGALTTTGGQGQQVGPFGIQPFRRRERRAPIRMDLIEAPDSVTVIAEMPGFKKEDIRVHVDENNLLEISAERREERTQQPGESVPHRELHYGLYRRMFKLPSYADPDQVQTEFNNGMLGIKFGRRSVPGHRQITVQ